MKQYLSITLLAAALSACSASDLAMLHPEASFLDSKKVSSVPKSQSITIVGSNVDEMGSYMPSFPAMGNTYYKKVHLSPVPKYVTIQCESENQFDNVRIRKSAFKILNSKDFNLQAGKTYMAFCNIQAGSRYKVVLREVPDGTDYGSIKSRNFTSPQPTDANRVRFITNNKSFRMWRSKEVNILNWNGKYAPKAELAAPISSVMVSCRIPDQKVRGSEIINVPLNGHFQAGKTYQIDCRLNEQGLLEAYIANQQ